MAARALIIAIEDYPQSTNLAPQLPGTNSDAQEFRQWLIDKKHLDENNILACTTSKFAWRTTGTTYDEIVSALQAISSKWKDEDNEEFYFYFSGHGFSYKTDDPATIQIDVLVASDFISTDQSGRACVQFQELQKKLWVALGPGSHYYFIDACRNPISREEIDVPTMGRKFPVSTRGRSNYYTLYSTALGQVAKGKSGFTKLLLTGLMGAGIAKRWDGEKMYVTFERLREYLRKKIVNQEIDASTAADQDGFIIEVNPIPEYECRVSVINATSEDSFDLKVRTLPIGEAQYSFRGDNFTVQLKPYDYYFEVTNPFARVVQIEPEKGPLSLYDAAEARFQKLGTTRSDIGSGAARASMDSTVRLEAAPDTEVHLVNEASGKKISGVGNLIATIPAGAYVAHVVERGMSIGRSAITIEAGKNVSFDLLQRPQSEMRERILASFSRVPTSRYTSFSETLGSIANWDLGLWLSIFGASHIVSDPAGFRLLKNLGLDRFQDLRKDDSPVYVLFGSERSEPPFNVALSDESRVRWETSSKVDSLVGIYERRIAAKPGSHLLSLQIGKQSPVSLAVYCLPNRVTFVTFAEDAEGRLGIHQYLLPVYTLSRYLEPRVFEYLTSRPLDLVRTIALAQTRFASNQRVERKGDTQEEQDWEALLIGKWLDPIMSLIACYEIIRRGKIESRCEDMRTVVGNLRTYFPGIPDIEVIARLAGLEADKIDAAPLLTDGLLLLEETEKHLRLPSSKLDYASPWTMWRGAVGESDTRRRTEGSSRRKRATSKRGAGAA
jgi:Caspase domain